jgi:hypothetical protein
MGLQSLLRRRPSAAIAISCTALFVALSGVGWAATQLPANSVGNTQLQNGSVTNWKLGWNAVGARKILNGAVGLQQINTKQVQARVSSPCATGAINSISATGSVTCSSTPPNEYGTSTSSAVTLRSGSTATQIATKALPGGSPYLVLAYPHEVIASTVPGQQVEVDCTLSVSPSSGATETKSLSVEIGPQARSQAGTIPLVVPAGSVANGSTATVSCTYAYTSGTTAPSVAVDTTINAIQTAANG